MNHRFRHKISAKDLLIFFAIASLFLLILVQGQRPDDAHLVNKTDVEETTTTTVAEDTTTTTSTTVPEVTETPSTSAPVIVVVSPTTSLSDHVDQLDSRVTHLEETSNNAPVQSQQPVVVEPESTPETEVPTTVLTCTLCK